MLYFAVTCGIICRFYSVRRQSVAGIKEVAEEAGVSTATVSRALRGLHHVNDSTR